MNKILLAIGMLLCFSFGYSQSETALDSIYHNGNSMSPKYIYKDKAVKPMRIKEIIKGNESAYADFSSSNSTYALGTVIGCVGGFMFGWQLGGAMGGAEINTPLLLGGVALAGVGIGISIKGQKGMFQAIDKYNSGLKTESTNASYLEFRAKANSVGVSLRF